MYRTIHVPVDNSDHSDASVDLAVALGKALGSRVIGSHVYAAKLHDVRFKQMEFTLPDEYKEEEELEKQRKIHDALIARGLHLISDSYLDKMETSCSQAGIGFERKHFDGKNFEAIVQDVRDSGYDLVVLGALGMGAVKDSQVGSVCERVLRRCDTDILVVRDTEVRGGDAPGGILCALDGSPESWGAFETALALARAFGKGVEVVAVPSGPADEDALLGRHLEAAAAVGARRGVAVETRLLEGSARPALLAEAARVKPWLLVAGRLGLDATEGTDVGGTAEYLVRHAACNVLLGSRRAAPAELLAADVAA